MERVNKGERYWYIITDDEDGGINTSIDFDDYSDLHDVRNRIGNYFHTKEESESMVRKLRAVLKGADVIEPMLNDDKFAKEAAEEYCTNNGLPAGACASQISYGHNCMYEGFIAGAEYGYKEAIKEAKEWLDSKAGGYLGLINENGLTSSIFKTAQFLIDFEINMNKLLEEKK